MNGYTKFTVLGDLPSGLDREIFINKSSVIFVGTVKGVTTMQIQDGAILKVEGTPEAVVRALSY